MHFEPGRKKMLFFTRGRGRGHAIPDIAIVRELEQLRPGIQVRFVSYGTGALTFAAHGIPCIDLQLPDQNSIAATTVLAGRLIAAMAPDIVVAHEEFSAMPVAKIFGLPTVMITDFFAAPGMLSMESLWYADRVLFLARRGLHVEPPPVRGKVKYLGPALRAFTYRRRDRRRARAELGLAAGATVVTVLPGSWTEAMAPAYDAVVSAFDRLRQPDKHLVWLAGADEHLLKQRVSAHRRDLTILGADWQIDRLMVASDLVIIKANRMTVIELASLGIRTLSLSYGLNPVDEQCVAGLEGNETIAIAALTPGRLRLALARPEPAAVRFRSRSCAKELSLML